MLKRLYKQRIPALLLFAFSIAACSEIIEESIEDATVTIHTPYNNAVLSPYTHTCWWSEVEDALKYHLQVVKGSFDTVGALMVDTLTSSNKYTMVLEPGYYQCRVRAENGSSMTVYTTHSFKVDTVSIASQKVLITGPLNNTYTSELTTAFSWSALFGTERYRIQIDSAGFANENNLVYNGLTTTTGFSYNFINQRNYQWRVRAENGNIFSLWSDVYTITIDRQSPQAPLLISPLNNAEVSLPVNFQWNTVADAENYELYVYRSDSVTLYNSSFPLNVSGGNHAMNVGNVNEKLYWRLKAVDKANNKSVFSNYGSFTVK